MVDLYICPNLVSASGHVAEWLGMGLQNLLRRFDSVHDLREQLILMAVVIGAYIHTPLFHEVLPIDLIAGRGFPLTLISTNR